MKKIRKIALAVRHLHLSASGIDGLAENYLRALEIAEDVKKLLLRACRTQGFRPKDAPKTKMLAGEFYEVLASRATRTDVDQAKAFKLRAREFAQFNRVFEEHLHFTIRQDWDRLLSVLSNPFRRKLMARVRACLVQRSSRRLTVRKKKSQPARAARRAA